MNNIPKYLDILKRYVCEDIEDCPAELLWNAENELELFFEKTGEESMRHALKFLVYNRLYQNITEG